ncbi:bifunctional nuclease family protein [Armatimonas sp.]|uniref:bifunctional nuclease family protein n=1 Tax=Armatimonas sp. TaxID=1872638 RepID=UPI00286BBD15|nr:bifunctional nuclease family protein [Armatimonas sp.]
MSSPYDETSENENRQPRALEEKEVEVLGLWEARTEGQSENSPIGEVMLMLRDGRGRRLPVHIGPFESMAIQNALQKTAPERPLTHDLLRNLLDKLGASLDRVVLDDLWQGTFYAKLHLIREKAPALEIDCRPSDAIALALRVRAPIFVAEHVLVEAAQDE